MSSSFDIVVARYQEPLEFLTKEPFQHPKYQYHYHIYNKGPTPPPLPASLLALKERYHYTNLPNVGKCDHTYLYHIIHHYDTLAELTLFVPASCMNVKYKEMKTRQTISTMHESMQTTFYGFFITNLQAIAGFQLNNWTTSDHHNRLTNQESVLTPATIRPFGAWHQSVFGKHRDLNFICYNGIFAVHRDDILQHPKSYYESLIKHVDSCSNPEAGHYLERSWTSVFAPLSVLSYHVFIVPPDND